MDSEQNMARETYRLAQENNRMLHAMRRNAFWGGIVKFILYAALIIAPVWFYLTYINGTVQNLVQAIDKIEGTGQQAQSQLNSFEQAWQQFEARFGFGTTTSQ
jgi:predicted PurR-regulated permease PerM